VDVPVPPLAVGRTRNEGPGRYRSGEIDAVAVDETIHQYHRAAQELWKFCWSSGVGANIEFVDDIIQRQSILGETVDWWGRGQPRRPR
jgi:hypothetical protein